MNVKTATLCIAMAAALLPAFAAPAAPAKPATVQVKETVVRDAPSFMGKPLGKLVAGDKLTVLEEKEGWMRVFFEPKKLQGWVHGSAVTRKEVALSSKGADKKVSDTEVALAGKGFSEQVERQYRADNPALDFGPVDEMEAVKVKPEEMQAFLKAGGIVPAEAGL